MNQNAPAHHSRLSVRIPIFVLLFSVIVAILFSLIQLFVEYREDVDLIKTRLHELAVSSSDVLAVNIWKLDEEQLSLQLRGMLQIPDIAYVSVASSDLGGITVGELPTGNSVELNHPLTYRTGSTTMQLGTLQIVASLKNVYTRLLDRGLLIMATEGIKTFLVSIFLLLLIHFLVTRRLSRMANYARDLTVTRLHEQFIPDKLGMSHKDDELDELVTAINTMLVDLKVAHYQLQNSHNTLEQKVDERTKELLLAKNTAEKASQAKSEFLATINHELRTPLTSILGGLGLIANGALGKVPENMQNAIDVAHRNSKRLLHLVNDILDVAKIDAGHLTLEISQIFLLPFLQNAAELNQAYAESFNVSLTIDACDTELEIHADAQRLHQVMNNLISNAIKFTHTGDVIEISAVTRGSAIEIRVTDHGPGIPDELKDSIFDKFTQADRSNTRATGGTGLGLSIARSIVKLHGGDIRFDSSPDQGTTFYIILQRSPISDKPWISSIEH